MRLLHPGLVREALEEPLTRLVEPISNLLRNLRVQNLKLWVPLSEVQGELPKLGFIHRVLVLLVLLLFGV